MKKKVLAIVAIVLAAVAFCLYLRSTTKVEPRGGTPRKTSEADRYNYNMNDLSMKTKYYYAA